MNTLDSADKRWLLPEGIEEVLPEQAAALEIVRRQVLDLYATWGYQLLITPMVEFLESLQTGTGKDLDLQTFKLIDSLSGRMMGVRADITPQAARIDARLIKTKQPVRLCYLGTVLRAYPDIPGGTRAPLQLGAELYGHAGMESDVEVIELMLETMKQLEIERYILDLGHVGVYRGLAKQAQLDSDQEQALFEALQRKAVPDINDLLTEWRVPNNLHTMMSALANLHGGVEVLAQAQALLAGAHASVKIALQELRQIAERLQKNRPELALHFDLSELRGYNYQSGVVFSVYLPGQGQEVARGGRYDPIGQGIGRSRPATGFSADLKTLMRSASRLTPFVAKKPIFAPCAVDESLQDLILALRTMGEIVLCELPGQEGDALSMGCDRILVQTGGEWELTPINAKLN